MTESRDLYEKVIQNNYCIGCGACTIVNDSPFSIKMDEYGNMVAYAVSDIDQSEAKVLEVCPFSGFGMNETDLSNEIFPEVEKSDHRIGKYIDCYAGYVNDSVFRDRGSSGGLGKWLGYVLLKEEFIDFLIHVEPNQSNNPDNLLFEYKVISDYKKVLQGSKSSYYPVTLESVLDIIKKNEGKYAITGVPCFIKAIRLVGKHNPLINSRVKYTIGIICGGMKSANQSKMIAWQMDVHPKNLIAIDFRRKYVDRPAKYKIYQVWSNADDIVRYKDSFDIYGTDWGSGYFKPNACEFCDDVVAETADISIGDAWLPDFESDPKGSTIIVVRNLELAKLLNKYISNGTLHLDALSAEDVAISQAGGLRHRRDALSLRIAEKEKKNIWYPQKRVKANEFPQSRKRRKIYAQRQLIARQSHVSFLRALTKDDLDVFFKEMKPLVRKYHSLNYGSLPIRGVKKAIRIASRLINN